MRKSPYLLAVVIILAAIGLGISNYVKNNSGSGQTNTNTIPSGGLSIANRGAAAFGTLGVAPTTPAQSGGVSTDMKASDSSARSSLIAPVPAQSVRYEYKGDALTLPSLPVLKRIKGFEGTDLQGILKSLNAPLANLDSFNKLGLQQVTFAENQENGYVITLDALAGTASIYQNWERWTTLQKTITRPAPTGSAADLPADSELTSIANAFLGAHSIRREGYGEPVVRKDWLMPGTSALAYVPTEISVVYPLLAEGKDVVDASGQAYGITVGINIATKLVTSVYNITSLRFEASTYPMVTKTETVLEVVQRGGVYGSTATNDAKALTIEVGTPKAGYLFSSYQLDSGSSDVLVPALIFPITKVPTGAQVYSKTIVVPLVQELIEPQIIQPLTSGGATGSIEPDAATDLPTAR
ncbi:MAG: hypothetical protein AAB445_02900 [Patescibacteria group bacterium]